MPRYFFNTRNGHNFPDHEGTDLDDLSAARLAALRFAGEILKEEGEDFWRTSEWHLDVSDESGSVLFSVDVSASGDGLSPDGR